MPHLCSGLLLFLLGPLFCRRSLSQALSTHAHGAEPPLARHCQFITRSQRIRNYYHLTNAAYLICLSLKSRNAHSLCKNKHYLTLAHRAAVISSSPFSNDGFLQPSHRPFLPSPLTRSWLQFTAIVPFLFSFPQEYSVVLLPEPDSLHADHW